MEGAPLLRSVLARQAGRRAVRSYQLQPSLRRCIQTSSPKTAQPLSHHPGSPGPPPEPPTPLSSSDADNRLDRKKRQAELLKRGQELRANPAKPTSTLQKRFWKDVTVNESPEGWNVMLDSRPVRTASKEVLNLPSTKHQLAAAIALEWDLLVSAQQALKQQYIPLTSLTSRVKDIELADKAGQRQIRNDITTMMMRYLDTDTLLCWAPEKSRYDSEEQIEDARKAGIVTLREKQRQAAEPIMKYLTSHVWPGTELLPITDPDSILPKLQPKETTETVRGWIANLPAYELGGLERAVLASKSLLVASRLLVEWSQAFAPTRANVPEGPRFGIEDAANACTLEVQHQTAMWGEVDDTHDVDKEDLRRQLGSTIVLVSGQH